MKLKIKSTEELPDIIIEMLDSGVDTVHNMKVDLNGIECVLCQITDDDHVHKIGIIKVFILLKTEDLTTLWFDSTLNWF